MFRRYFILLYDWQAWTLNQIHLIKLADFELWCYMRFLQISLTVREFQMRKSFDDFRKWTRNRTNNQKLPEYVGHITSGQASTLLQLVLQGKVRVKRRSEVRDIVSRKLDSVVGVRNTHHDCRLLIEDGTWIRRRKRRHTSKDELGMCVLSVRKTVDKLGGLNHARFTETVNTLLHTTVQKTI